MSSVDPVKELEDWLDGIQLDTNGSIPEYVKPELESRLAEVWDDLTGSDDEGMRSYKLRDRIEKPCWIKLVLSFSIERHGALKMGSSRASMHGCEVDLEKRTAAVWKGGYRQIEKMAKRINVVKLAQEVAGAIFNEDHADPRLRWKSSN